MAFGADINRNLLQCRADDKRIAARAGNRGFRVPLRMNRCFHGGILSQKLNGAGHEYIVFERELEKRMLAFTPEMQERFSEMEKIGSLSVGRDAWDLGITAYGRYHHIKKTSFFQSLAGKQR